MPDKPRQRLILFLDAQNFYRGARRAFFSPQDSSVCGQIDPMKLAELLCSLRKQPDNTEDTIAHEVRIYTGRPDATKEPKSYAANVKQCNAWAAAGAKVIHRSLRYPLDWPLSKAQEKGIDVTLAIDFVALAVQGKYDVGVIASSDTDLKPALEFVYSEYGKLCNAKVEVTAWHSLNSLSRLSIPGAKLWCHWLDRSHYDSIEDNTDYNL